jgi:hypothetical protein
MADEVAQLTALVTQAEERGREAGRQEGGRTELGKRAAAVVLRGHAAALEASAAALTSVQPAADTLTTAATRLRQRADALDKPGA